MRELAPRHGLEAGRGTDTHAVKLFHAAVLVAREARGRD